MSGLTGRAVYGAVGKTFVKELSYDIAGDVIGSGTSSFVFDLTGNVNLSRLAELSAGMMTSGNSGKTLNHVDNVTSSTVKGLNHAVYASTAGTKIKGIKTWDEISDILAKENLNKRKIDEILSTPKGMREDPSKYLSDSYIKQHLSNFQDGVTKIKSKAPVGTEGVGLGTFVMPKSVADDVIARSEGNVTKLEELLGLNPGDLGDNPVRVDISYPKNIRIPSGNEAGAWPGYWTPGGYTKPGGVMEAVIDPVPKGDYVVTENILGK